MGNNNGLTLANNNVANIIKSGIQLVDTFINKSYLIDMSVYEPIPFPEEERSFSNMSLFKINKIVYNDNENINDKLVSVYSALYNFGSTALLVICSNASGINFYLGTKHTNNSLVAKEILKKSLKGNFPGVEIEEKNAIQVGRLL